MPADYPLLRLSLDPAYAAAPTAQLRVIVESIYGPGVTPEDVEGLFDDIGKGFKSAAAAVGGFAQQAAPMVVKALPNIAQGAMAGSAFGPYGMLIGGLAGGASGILQQSSNPTARAIGGTIHDAGSLVSTIRGGGATGGLGSLGSIATGALGQGAGAGAVGAPSGGGASNALMGLLSRPELLQALMAGAMGDYGRQNVTVGTQQVPVHAVLSTLGTLAGRAAQEAAELDASAMSEPRYVTAASEALGIDADDAEGRTDALLTLLALSPSIWANQQPRPVTVNVSDPPQTAATAKSDEDYEADEDFEDFEGEDGEDWADWDESAEADEAEWDEAEAIYA